MDIALKNIKYAAFASEETACYEASLYVDGKRIGTVANDGHGGPDRFHGDQAAYEQANQWLADNYPPVELFHGQTTPMGIEMCCARLLDEHLMAKELKRALKSKVLYYQPDEKQIMELGWKGVRKIDERHIQQAAQKYPDAVILNTLPFDEALAAYWRYAAVA
jgi:hypothetical protein